MKFTLSFILPLAFLTIAPNGNLPTEETKDDVSLYNYRYCEIILAKMESLGKLKTEVYNSMLCNECPQEQWEGLDFEVIAKDHGAKRAVANGPRYWVLDRIDSAKKIEICKETFGNLEMSKVATINVPLRKARKKSAYRTVEVNRKTNFYFKAGREVYVLESDQGECYIMQSYSQTIDKTLQISDLSQLGERLKLPKGWSFRAAHLEEDLNLISPKGKATVLQDNLENTYQHLHESCGTIK